MQLSEALGWFYLSMDCVKSPSTIDFYKRRLPSLVTVLGDIALDSVTINDLRRWRSHIANRDRQPGHLGPRRDAPKTNRPGKLSIHTVDQYIRAARRFFRWCFLEGHIDANPAARLERPPLPAQRRRGIPKADIQKMLAIAQADQNIREAAIIRVLADSACRVGGIAGLRLADLNLEQRRAVVREKGRGGNNKERTLQFKPKTVEALRAWLQVRPPTKDDHVFVSTYTNRHFGKPLSEHGIYQALKRIAQQANIETGFNPHNFRHGAIRGWLANGMPLSTASQLAGHSSVQVTGDIYGTANDDELQTAHDRYGWMD